MVETPKKHTNRRYITVDSGGSSSHASGLKPPFTRGVIAANLLFLSAITDGGPQPGDTPADAARRALDALKATLAQAGATMDDLVWMQVCSRDLSLSPIFNEVYTTYFSGLTPARAMIGAGDLPFEATFQVMGIAHVE